jgi:hypothetical protein
MLWELTSFRIRIRNEYRYLNPDTAYQKQFFKFIINLSQDIILATAILHNLAILWKVEEFDEEEGEDRGGDDGYWQAEQVEILQVIEYGK